ncbi:MAG: carbohydrate binding domain-containing protein [Armatimonadetes bacterium]|nr:carbohydrate binding domain-containing protein [Armatimonadota bacterium]
MAAHWTFEEGSGTVAADASGNGHSGMLQGGAGWAPGLVGAHALRLPGRPGSFVDVPAPAVDTTKSFTAAAWVKVNDVSGFQTFVSIDGDRVSGFYLQLRADTGRFGFAVLPGDDPGDNRPALASANDDPEPDTWYHLAGVYDATAQTVTLYVNGQPQETVPFKSSWRAPGHTEIGRGKFGGRPVDFVGGAIDDVRLYQAALPAADVRALAQPYLQAAAPAAPLGPVTLAINVGQVTAHVSPLLYGLMTEEISHSYDGGLYAELIQNRVFKDNPDAPAHWSLVQDGGATGAIALDTGQPLSAALPVSLKLTVSSASGTQRAGAANDGYWGIPVTPNTRYRVSFYAKADPAFAGPLTLSIESNDGATVYARARVANIGPGWKQYAATLTTGTVAPTEAARFVVSASRPGTLWLDLVSLFPPTYHNRPNGNRVDLMQKLADMKPAFLRLPGGNYLEGNTIAERFEWKDTVGPLTGRPGHQGPWGYRSSDGMGLLEFLEWCEDLRMQPVLAVYAGFSLRGEYVAPGPALQPYVQDALDEIEYVAGDASTRWGAERVKDGHPAPFPLHYVEIGNEDFFDRSGSYDGRFAQFYDAIKAKYPKLQLIATTRVRSRTPDVIDEHYYRSAREMERDAHHYDGYSRTGPKVFVGEWASQEGRPTPDMNAALGDAAWMTGMERNSDVVVIESYAPLFVNVNPGGSQWGTNLIGYDALTSYGSPSYYAQQMFSRYHGDVVLGATLDGAPRLSYDVTRDSRKGTVYLKVVNTAGMAQPAHVTVGGVRSVAPDGIAVVLTSAGPRDTNTLADPNHVVPRTLKVNGLGPNFSYTFPPYSITILEMQVR